MPVGRTRAAATSRSLRPISRPTPEPKASSLRKSLEMESSRAMAGSVAPRRVVPAQNVDGAIETGGHVLDLRGDRAFQIGELTVGQLYARGGADGENRVAFAPQHPALRAKIRHQ